MRGTGQTSSLTDRTNAAIVNAMSGRKRSLMTPLLFAGPAVIASIAYMDPGNFATNIQAGSRYGYMLLWVVVMANMIAMLFQALSARLGIVTHKNLAEMCRDQFPKPVVWGMWGAVKLPQWRPIWPNFSGVLWDFHYCSICRYWLEWASRRW